MFYKTRFADNKAFTLIELLVVVAIIGILAAVGVVAYNGYTKSAKKKAVEQYHEAMRFGYSKEIVLNNIGNIYIKEKNEGQPRWQRDALPLSYARLLKSYYR